MSAPVPPRPAQTPPRRLTELVSNVAGLASVGAPLEDVQVSGITHDSHTVRPGDIFAALPGSNAHGAQHVGEAAACGAHAVLTDEAGVDRARATALPVLSASDVRRVLGWVARWVYDDPSSRLRVLGVTGTNGKTTTAYLMEAGLQAAGLRTGLLGTVETRIGDLSMPSLHTTPEATDLQAMFAVMREHAVSAVAMEVSSHALALDRVDGTKFSVAAFTNLSQDHLDFHRDMDDYYAAKARLFTPEFTTAAVVTIDDGYGARLAAESPVSVTTLSVTGRTADWSVTDVLPSASGSDFTLHGPAGVSVLARVRLPGTFNVANAALAILSLVQTGVALRVAVDGVATCTCVPGRMQRVDLGQPFVALVDYAHTPEAVTTLLASLRPATHGRLIAVLGCGGDRDRAKRPLMGAAVARGADVAVLTSDNPRSEDPDDILTAMRAGAAEVTPTERAEVVVEPDRRAAIRLAVEMAGPGDVVVLAGKGHERVQEIAGQRVPFDDAQELSAAIAATVPAS